MYFSLAVISTMTKSSLEKKRAYFILQLYIPSLREADAGNQGRILNQKLQSRAAYWLVPRFTFSYLSYKTPELLPKKGTAYSGLSPPTPMSNHKSIFIDTLTPMEAICQLVFPLPRGVRLTT